jgi:hypothetical protein
MYGVIDHYPNEFLNGVHGVKHRCVCILLHRYLLSTSISFFMSASARDSTRDGRLYERNDDAVNSYQAVKSSYMQLALIHFVGAYLSVSDKCH